MAVDPVRRNIKPESWSPTVLAKTYYKELIAKHRLATMLEEFDTDKQQFDTPWTSRREAVEAELERRLAMVVVA